MAGLGIYRQRGVSNQPGSSTYGYLVKLPPMFRRALAEIHPFNPDKMVGHNLIGLVVLCPKKGGVLLSISVSCNEMEHQDGTLPHYVQPLQFYITAKLPSFSTTYNYFLYDIKLVPLLRYNG